MLFSSSLDITGGQTDEEIIEGISQAVKRKAFKHGGYEGMDDIANNKNRPMILIGG